MTLESLHGTRVLVVGQLPPPHHGSSKMTQVLGETLHTLGVEVELVDKRFSNSVSQVGRFSIKKILALPSLIGRTWRASARADLCVYFTTNRFGSLLVDWLLRETLRIRRVPVVHYVHTVGFQELVRQHAFMRLPIRRLLSGDDVVTLTPSMAKDLSGWVPPRSVRAIPNTVPTPTAPLERKKIEGPIIFLSNLMPEKGADTFIEICAHLRHQVPNDFIIAGSTTDNSYIAGLRELASKLDLDERLKFVGHVDADSKHDLLQSAAFLIFPSRYKFEAQPLSILEAMAAGVPTIASDIGGIPDTVIDGVTGTVINSDHPADYANAITAIFMRPEIYESQSDSCRDRASSVYNSSSFNAAWRSLISETRR